MDCIKMALRRICTSWKKTLLTIIGIAIGTCSVIVIRSLGAFGTQTMAHELQNLGLGGALISHTDPSASMTEEEIRFLRQVNDIQYVMPLVVTISTYSDSAEQSKNALIFGVDEGVGNIISLQISEGRSLQKSDVEAGASVCMIDDHMAAQMFHEESAIGQEIAFSVGGQTITCTIIGVSSSSGLLQNSLQSYIPGFVYIPYSALQQELGLDSYQQVIVQFRSAEKSSLADRLPWLMGRYFHNTGAYRVQSLAQQKGALEKLMNGITVLLTLIGGISLFVACLNIMTNMLISVRERTREIGIKKSIGAPRWAIQLEFLAEAAMVSVLGSLLGIAIGWLLIRLLAHIGHLSIQVSIQSCAIGLGAAVVCGSAFGLYPAVKAASLNPIEALQRQGG